jgi:hypothetical protein
MLVDQGRAVNFGPFDSGASGFPRLHKKLPKPWKVFGQKKKKKKNRAQAVKFPSKRRLKRTGMAHLPLKPSSRSENEKKKLPIRESNPGQPRERRRS